MATWEAREKKKKEKTLAHFGSLHLEGSGKGLIFTKLL
jgi:hypothetical protein